MLRPWFLVVMVSQGRGRHMAIVLSVQTVGSERRPRKGGFGFELYHAISDTSCVRRHKYLLRGPQRVALSECLYDWIALSAGLRVEAGPLRELLALGEPNWKALKARR